MELQELDVVPQIQIQEFTQEPVEDLNHLEVMTITVAEAVHLYIKDLQEIPIAPIVLLHPEEVPVPQGLRPQEVQVVPVEVQELQEVPAEEVLLQEEAVEGADRNLRT